MLTFFISIFARLFFLQVKQGPAYLEQARENTTHTITQTSPRGIIYDREHRVLASNKQSASAMVLPSVVLGHDVDRIVHLLSNIVKKSESEIRKDLDKLKKDDSRPFPIANNLTLEQVATIYENQYELPGVMVQQQSARYYANGESSAHVLGYTGKISPSELENNPDREMNDIVGKYGIEKLFDSTLRGASSHKRIKINRQGQPTEPISFDDDLLDKNRAGKDIVLTIDLDLQQVAEQKMKGMKGAVVMIDVNTGEILTLVSQPSFDPNLFAAGINPTAWKVLNAKNVLMNRAISAYPPGSIWKPLVLLAALESGAVKPGERFSVSGAYFMDGFRFGDWTSKIAVMGLTTCLAWSRDTAFYQMGRRMNDRDITEWGKRLGAGRATGIEFKGESNGSLPDEIWKAKAKLRNSRFAWYKGNTLHYSIGQGPLLVTPAQAVRIAAGIATGNRTPKIHLVKQIGDKLPGKPSFDTFRTSPELIKIVHDGMSECIESGTCQASKLKGVKVAGKTGSAEAPPNPRTHGWFIAYAPADKPEVAIVAFGEAAGHGGAVAAPIAKEVLQKYFEKYHRMSF